MIVNFREIQLPADPLQAQRKLKELLAKFESGVLQKIEKLSTTQSQVVTEETVTAIVTDATGNFFDKTADTFDDIKNEGTLRLFFTAEMKKCLQDIVSDTVAVTSGLNKITFPEGYEFDDTDYQLTFYAQCSDGSAIGLSNVAKAAGYFNCVVTDAGTMDYIAVRYRSLT